MAPFHFKIIILACLIPFFATGQEQYRLILEKGTYETGSSKLGLDIIIENNSQDTLVMVKPGYNHFLEHYAFQGIRYIGEKQKPYNLQLNIETPCEEEVEMMAPVQDYPKSVHLRHYDIVSIPPGERSKKYSVFINLAGLEFCEEGLYSARLIYNPQYETITAKQRKFLENKKKAFDDLIRESRTYIEKEKLSPDTLSTSGTPLHLVLDSYYNIQSLTETSLISEKIELTQK